MNGAKNKFAIITVKHKNFTEVSSSLRIILSEFNFKKT